MKDALTHPILRTHTAEDSDWATDSDSDSNTDTNRNQQIIKEQRKRGRNQIKMRNRHLIPFSGCQICEKATLDQ